MTTLVAALLLTVNATARAQSTATAARDRIDPERFLVEGSVSYWVPGADIQFASDSSGVPGTTIDGRRDLGLGDRGFGQWTLVARLARRHKVRLQYVPIAYQATAVASTDVTFNGRAYHRGSSITTTIDWTAYQVGYEYDVLLRPRWYVGVVGEVKQTDIRVRLASFAEDESRRTQIPVPALGATGRFYPAARFSITGQMTAMAVPDRPDHRYGGHYIDGDVYGTFTFTRFVAVQAGFRSLDLRHLGASDAAKITLRGVYVGGVLRR